MKVFQIRKKYQKMRQKCTMIWMPLIRWHIIESAFLSKGALTLFLLPRRLLRSMNMM